MKGSGDSQNSTDHTLKTAVLNRQQWDKSEEAGRCRAADLASIRLMSGQVSRGSAREYQADERNPKLLIYPSPLPIGNHKFVFCVHESFCFVNKFMHIIKK